MYIAFINTLEDGIIIIINNIYTEHFLATIFCFLNLSDVSMFG